MASKWEEWKKNVGESRPWHVLNEDNHVEEEIARKRFNICMGCPELTRTTHQCKKCGCFMALKTKLENASCPLDKW